MLPPSYRIASIQKTLHWFEQDMALLNLRLKDLSRERQSSARQYAAALITHTRAELNRLLEEQPETLPQPEDAPCEPAD